MGRGGGFSGGSGFHGGGGGRTHYGGGGGGRGGRSSGSFGRGPSRPSGGGPRGPRRPPRFHAPPPRHHHGPYYRSGYVGRPMGCFPGCSSVLALAIVLIMVLVIFAAVHGTSDEPITASTVERTKLPASDCRMIDEWFEDHMRPAWISNTRDLIKGMQAFYSKTGVQPYLVLLPNIDGDVYPSEAKIVGRLAEIYDEIMPDGGHVIVGFVEGVENEYGIGVYAGAKAEIVMDEEAREILMDYLDYYYDSDLEDEEYFATAFEKTASKIMTIDEIKSVSKQKTIKTVVIIVGVAAIVITVAVAIVRSKKHKAEQAKADAEILKSNLSDMSDTDPLKDKYDVGNDKEQKS